jgi:hypothetical protein
MVQEPRTVEHLKRGRVERTFAADLANKLKPAFEKERIAVDSHYNKHHGAAKRLNRRLIELDVAVHERGTDENNLVAIELETTNAPERDDVWKVEGLTQPLAGYGYGLGLFLVVGINDRAGYLGARMVRGRAPYLIAVASDSTLVGSGTRST